MEEASEWERGKQYFAYIKVVNVLAQQLFSDTSVSQAKLPSGKKLDCMETHLSQYLL